MDILIDRDVRTRNSTIGILYIDGALFCYTLEDRDGGLKQTMPLSEIYDKKVKGFTAIPEGKYEVVITYSNRFKKEMPLVKNVPGYEGIRIHPGNTDADTEGCILPGTNRDIDFVGGSRIAFAGLLQKITFALSNNEKVFLEIKS